MLPVTGHYLCNASECGTGPGPCLESVTVDTASYVGNPWKIFHCDITVKNGTGPSKFKAKVRLVDFHGQSEADFDEAWEPAEETSVERKYIGYTDRENAENDEGPAESYDGTMGCEGVIIEGNAWLNSYDGSSADYPDSVSSEMKVYSNGSIVTRGNAEVRGSLYGHDISVLGNSTITGETVVSDNSRDCLKDDTDTIRELVMTENNNDRVVVMGTTTFDPQAGQLDLHLAGAGHVFLPEGIYYFTSLHLSGQSCLEIEGKVIIFVQSDIVFDGHAEINAAGATKYLALNSLTGSIDVRSQARVWAEMFAPHGTVKLTGNSEVFGRAVGNLFHMSGTSQFHFNQEDMYQYLRVTAVDVYDEEGNLIGSTLVPIMTVSLKIAVWKIELVDGHYHTYLRQEGQWEHQGRIHLAGYSDYQLVFDSRIMHWLVEWYENKNLCRYVLGYPEGTTWKRLNYHRCWATSWTVQEDTGTTWYETCDHPWEMYGWAYRIVQADYPDSHPDVQLWQLRDTFRTCPSYDRSSKEAHLCYWNRLRRLLDDTLVWGAVVQIDLFDNAIMKMDQHMGGVTVPENGVHADVDRGGWQESPWNPANRVGGNELDPIEAPETYWACDLDNSVYTIPKTNYFFLTAPDTAPGTQTDLPVLKSQQKNLVKAVVSFCRPYQNIIYHAMNEPKYHHFYGSECLKWHKMVVGWINDVSVSWANKPKFGVNVYEYEEKTQEAALIELVNGINNDVSLNIDVSSVAYHGLGWWNASEDCSQNDITDLVNWHRDTQPVKNLACIVDTDGAGACRENPDVLWSWADLVHDYEEDFNHKGPLWTYYDANGNYYNQFDVDYEAMKMIYEAFHLGIE